MVLGEKQLGIWGFLQENLALLFLALLIQRPKNPFSLPQKTENPETVVDFPKAKLELGRLATDFLTCFVGKWSAKAKKKDEDAISFLAISDLLIRAHNPEVAGSSPVPAPKNPRSQERGFLLITYSLFTIP